MNLAAPFFAWAAWAAGRAGPPEEKAGSPAGESRPGQASGSGQGLTRRQARQLAHDLSRLGPRNFLTLNLAAESALAEGDTDEARRLFLQSLEFEPGQSFLFSRLRELKNLLH